MYLQLWAAGLVLFGVSCWVLGELLDRYHVQEKAGIQHVKEIEQ